MADRCTPDTEHLVAQACLDHIDEVTAGPDTTTALLTCSCGAFTRAMPIAADWEAYMAAFRHHRAAAILTALADAGALLPVGGETRQEYGYRSPRGTIMRGWSSSPPDFVRNVTVWPTEDQPNDNWPCYVGPWREVTDDPA